MREVKSLEQARDILMEAWAAGIEQRFFGSDTGKCALDVIFGVESRETSACYPAAAALFEADFVFLPPCGHCVASSSAIWWLNDSFCWSFLQIAEWMDGIIQERSKQNGFLEQQGATDAFAWSD